MMATGSGGIRIRGFALMAIWVSWTGIARGDSCGAVMRLEYGSQGSIISPAFPSDYPPHTSCLWRVSYPPDTFLWLRLEEIDIEEDASCSSPPCCTHNWLKFSSRQLCGRHIKIPDVVVENKAVSIKFHSSKVYEGGSGFHISYLVCRKESFRCAHRLYCIVSTLRCDGFPQCDDGSDEWGCPENKTIQQNKQDEQSDLLDECDGSAMVPCGGIDKKCFNNITERCDGNIDCPFSAKDETDCPLCGPKNLYCRSGGCYPLHGPCEEIVHCAGGRDDELRGGCSVCSKNYVLCSRRDPCYCFNMDTQRCDGQIDCPRGEDETSCVLGCENKIACASVQGCYLPSERCDGVAQCFDNSDEVGCQTFPTKFKCVSTRYCVDDFMVCNGEDDCGDGSDEADCIKNSVIIVVIMGSLICGLLAVFGAAIAWRYYSSRSRLNILGIQNSYQRQENVEPLDDSSLYHLYREPPPSYQEAIMQGASPPVYCYPTRYMNVSVNSESVTPVTVARLQRPRSSRVRTRSNRSIPKPNSIVKPPDEARDAGANDSQVITGDQLYPENNNTLSDSDTPMLEFSDNNTGTSSTEILTSDSSANSPSEISGSNPMLPEYNSGYRPT